MTRVNPVPRGRREEYAEATRAALLDSATSLFAEHGYLATSLDDVVGAARVTKGALYHHFRSKQDLFEAVFTVQEARAVTAVTDVTSRHRDDPWAGSLAALNAYLDLCLDPAFRRVVLQESLIALGWKRAHELEQQHTFGLLQGMLALLVDAGVLRPEPVPALARVMFGALSAAALEIAESNEPATRREFGQVLQHLLEGLRT